MYIYLYVYTGFSHDICRKLRKCNRKTCINRPMVEKSRAFLISSLDLKKMCFMTLIITLDRPSITWIVKYRYFLNGGFLDFTYMYNFHEIGFLFD